MALWRAKDKPPVELVVANLEAILEQKYMLVQLKVQLKNRRKKRWQKSFLELIMEMEI